MRDNIFIGWSSDTKLAKMVKKELTRNHFQCVIGGNDDAPGNLSIADTIAAQIDQCCQSIFIIKKNKHGLISNNITFEIGYSVSKYNSSLQKLHLFYLDIDPKDDSIPTDLLGLWANHLSTEGRTDEEIVQEIVSVFMKHQKTELVENKMSVVTDWLNLYMLLSTNLETPRYSDFDIAQYIFLLIESASNAHTWKESRELVKRYEEVTDESSLELYMAIRLFEVTGEMYDYRKTSGHHIYLSKSDFRMLRSKMQSLIDNMVRYTADDTVDPVFAKWYVMTAKQRMQFFYMSNSNDPEVKDKTPIFNKAEAMIHEDMELVKELMELDPAKNKEYLWEILFMLHRNLAVIAQFRGDKEAERKERFESLFYTREIRNKYYGKIDTRVWETFEREYYMALTECLEFMDEIDVEDAREELRDYVEQMLELRDSNIIYINRIKQHLADKPVSGL